MPVKPKAALTLDGVKAEVRDENYTDGFDQGKPWREILYLVAYEDKNRFQAALVGGVKKAKPGTLGTIKRILPHRHPANENLYCVSTRSAPIGAGRSHQTELIAADLAEILARYEPVPIDINGDQNGTSVDGQAKPFSKWKIRLYTETEMRAAESVIGSRVLVRPVAAAPPAGGVGGGGIGPGGGIDFKSNPGPGSIVAPTYAQITALSPKRDIPVRVLRGEANITFFDVPFLFPNVYINAVGTLNNDVFLGFNKGCWFCQDADFENDVDTAGNAIVNLSISLELKSQDWNLFPREDDVGFIFWQGKGSGQYLNYTYTDFRLLIN